MAALTTGLPRTGCPTWLPYVAALRRSPTSQPYVAALRGSPTSLPQTKGSHVGLPQQPPG
ncbi:hypothetical protein [Haliscomenobacter sp.]|uniref:hypothetical protein n=1 Tax=Haliscomenobacter sp. TaxID=2717303 RepID=UPI003593627A